MAESILVVSSPEQRRRDVSPGGLASLERLARKGGIAGLIPVFPGTAASAFAKMSTGTEPDRHGIEGDTYYDREARRVVSRPLLASLIPEPKLWDRLRSLRPGARTLLWFTTFAESGAEAGELWSGPEGPTIRPEELAAELTRDFGPYPCP